MSSIRTTDSETLYDREESEPADWADDDAEDEKYHGTDGSEAVLLKRTTKQHQSTATRPDYFDLERERERLERERPQSYIPPQLDRQGPTVKERFRSVAKRSSTSRKQLGKFLRRLPTNKEDLRETWNSFLSWKSSIVLGERTKSVLSFCFFLGLWTLVFGILTFIFALFGLWVNRIFNPVTNNPYSSATYNDTRPATPASHWPTDYTADIIPVHCHSHNDYWRPIPLISAISAGCTGVEADVWQLDDELYVGHSLSSLTAKRTFRSLYIDPLLEILNRQNPQKSDIPSLKNPKLPFSNVKNGVFDTNPEETLVLLVDFKPSGGDTWRYVTEQLAPLRKADYLTYFDGEKIIPGAVTVVATGEAPFEQVIANTTYRDIFYDAPLEVLSSTTTDTGTESSTSNSKPSSVTNTRYDPTKELAYLAHIAPTKGLQALKPTDVSIYTSFNSYYASTSFFDQIGIPIPFLRDSQRRKIQQQVAGAHAQGLKVRYWETPGWPKGLRNYIWRELLKEGIDFLNVDDVWEAARGNWGWLKRGEEDGNET